MNLNKRIRCTWLIYYASSSLTVFQWWYWRLQMPCHTNKSASSWTDNNFFFLKERERKDDMVEWAKLRSALARPGRPWPLKHSYLVTSFNAFTRDQQTSGREAFKSKCSLVGSASYRAVKTTWRNQTIVHTISGIDRIYSTIYNKTCFPCVFKEAIVSETAHFKVIQNNSSPECLKVEVDLSSRCIFFFSTIFSTRGHTLIPAIGNKHSCFPSIDTSHFHPHLLFLQTHTHTLHQLTASLY